jgi:hypothetical protein
MSFLSHFDNESITTKRPFDRKDLLWCFHHRKSYCWRVALQLRDSFEAYLVLAINSHADFDRN